jgi:hypothetical protein
MGRIRSCETCGTEFNAARESRRYCSLACSAQGRTRPVPDRFWALVNIREPDQCWVWQGTRFVDGCGLFPNTLPCKTWRAPRIAWYLTHGTLPSDLFVCHTCDNIEGSCCNPNHMWLGTIQENTADRHAKGRDARVPDSRRDGSGRFVRGMGEHT